MLLQGGYTWTVPSVCGNWPDVRYGHSATRCGREGECLLVYGGMQARVERCHFLSVTGHVDVLQPVPVQSVGSFVALFLGSLVGW